MDLSTNSGASVSVSDVVFGAKYNEGLVHQIQVTRLKKHVLKSVVVVQSLGVRKEPAELERVLHAAQSGLAVGSHSRQSAVITRRK